MKSSGRVAELLFDESSNLIDYTFTYPYFHYIKNENEYILYGILEPGSFHHEAIQNDVFMTAAEAEDYLLAQLPVLPMHQMMSIN